MRLTYRTLRILAHMLYILYGRGRVYGVRNVPSEGAVLIASSHQSYFDPVLVGLPIGREVQFMARDTLFRNRYFRWLITHLNAFPIKRGSADLGAIKEALRRLKAGGVVVAFPEGTRTRDGRIGPLQPGIVGIARRANCPIVPTIIEGAHQVWPRDRLVPGLAKLWVEYGKPVYPDDFADMEPAEAARLLTDRLRAMHNALRQRIGRSPFEYDEKRLVATATNTPVAVANG